MIARNLSRAGFTRCYQSILNVRLRQEVFITFHASQLGGLSDGISQQEGQHPLTGQRAANFRLLANQ